MPAFPAARALDQHVCPAVNPIGTPHVGGPILMPVGANVLINSLPAAKQFDQCLCSGPPDFIQGGSSNVLINSLPAARFLDATLHGGKILAGSANVFIGG